MWKIVGERITLSHLSSSGCLFWRTLPLSRLALDSVARQPGSLHNKKKKKKIFRSPVRAHMFVPRSVRAPASSSSKPLRPLSRAAPPLPVPSSKSPTSPSGPLKFFPSSAEAARSEHLTGNTTVAVSDIPVLVSSGPSSSSASLSASAVDHVSSVSHRAPVESAPVLHLQHGTVCTPAATPGSALTEDVDLNNSQGDLQDDPIVLKSIDQRAAEADEPTCVVCSRYGEYICDETDDDVCSLECKAIVLQRRPNCNESKTSPQAVPDSIPSSKQESNVHITRKTKVFSQSDLPVMQDDFIIVRDGEQPLPEWEPDAVVRKLTQQQVDFLRTEINVSVQGEDVPKPILEFSNCRFMPKLLDNLEIVGYESPTPVQMQIIPAALKGRDLLVSAGTGLGKTVGYLLSVVFRSCRIRSHFRVDRQKPLAIVLTPTRELCVQVEEQAKTLAKGLPLKTALVVGGDAMPQQIHRLKQGVELIIGTPGRMIDLFTKHDVELDYVCMLVLDEVETMLDRGFRDQVMQIVTALTQPQIMMFSATIPPDIQKFSTSLLKRPVQISVGKTSLPSESVKQTVIWVETKNKKNKLFDILSSPHHFRPPVVVFVTSRMGAELLADAIRNVTGLQAAAVHGEKSMQERREVLKSFLMGGLPIVVATGVLGRGLDLLRVTQVVIFDMPSSLDEYIHQIGRASRLGLPGSAMVFINDESKLLFKPLIEILRSSGVIVPKELASSPYAISSYAAAYNPRKRKAYKKSK